MEEKEENFNPFVAIAFFLISLLVVGQLLDEDPKPLTTEQVEKEYQKTVKEVEEHKKSQEQLATVLAISLSMDSLRTDLKNICPSKADLGYSLLTLERVKTIAKDHKDAKWREELETKADEIFTKIEENYKEFQITLDLINTNELEKATVKSGFTAPQKMLTTFMENNCSEVSKLLIKKGVALDEKKFQGEKARVTPLAIASSMKEKEQILKALLLKDFPITTWAGATTLTGELTRFAEQTCISEEDLILAKDYYNFLEKNLQINNKETLIESAKELLKSVEFKAQKEFETSNLEKDTFIYYFQEAVDNRCENLARDLMANKEYLEEFFIKREPDFIKKSKLMAVNYTPLTYALKKRNYKVAKLLLENGVSPNKTSSAYPPITYCNSNLDCAKTLYSFGAKLNRYSIGIVDLMAYGGNLEGVKFFLKEGADANLGKEKAKNLALKNGHMEIVEYLEEWEKKNSGTK